MEDEKHIMTTNFDIPEINYAEIESLLNASNRPLVLFSGGKDSLVLAHILEPYKDKFELVWINTGAMFPHMVEFVRNYGKSFNFVELTSDQPARLIEIGLPAYIVPSYNTINAIYWTEGERKAVITDWRICCSDLRTLPAIDYAKSIGSEVIIHGQRDLDNGGLPNGVDVSGVNMLGLIYNWSSAHVFNYIDKYGIELPEQYYFIEDHESNINRESMNLSLECWNCTANISNERVNYMRARYPELLDELKPNIAAVYSSVFDDINKTWPAIENAFSD